jgi:hypothetical protein
MKPSRLTLATLALLLLLAFSSPARADFIPWMYNWSRSPNQILSDAPGTGYIALTDESLKGAVGDTDIVATNMRTFSTATVDNPDIFTARTYSLTLFLLDLDSGMSGTLTFTGQLDGELGATFSRMTNTFIGPPSQSLVLGQNRYTASSLTFSPPGIPGAANAGSVSAHATVVVEQVPEPSSFALYALGSFALGVARRLLRRRRRARREQEAK